MAVWIPSVNGPKLFPFEKNLQDLIFVRQLSCDEEYTSDRIPMADCSKSHLLQNAEQRSMR